MIFRFQFPYCHINMVNTKIVTIYLVLFRDIIPPYFLNPSSQSLHTSGCLNIQLFISPYSVVLYILVKLLVVGWFVFDSWLLVFAAYLTAHDFLIFDFQIKLKYFVLVLCHWFSGCFWFLMTKLLCINFIQKILNTDDKLIWEFNIIVHPLVIICRTNLYSLAECRDVDSVSTKNDFTLSLKSNVCTPFLIYIFGLCNNGWKKFLQTSSRECGAPFAGWMTHGCICGVCNMGFWCCCCQHLILFLYPIVPPIGMWYNTLKQNASDIL